MIERINSIINIFDVGDLKFFFLVVKKNIKNLIILSLIVSLLALFVSLNQEKKYLSIIQKNLNKFNPLKDPYYQYLKNTIINR